MAVDGGGGVHQSRVNVLPLTAVTPVNEGCQNCNGGIESGEDVRHRHGGAHGARAGCAIGLATGAHQAAHGLHHRVVGRAIGIGAVLPKAGDAAINNGRIDSPNALVIQAIALEPTHFVVLNKHLAVKGQLAYQFGALRRTNVYRDRALAPVAAHEKCRVQGGLAVSAHHKRANPPCVIASIGALDLDHIGPQVGQGLGAPGAGDYAGQVQHPHFVKNCHGVNR